MRHSKMHGFKQILKTECFGLLDLKVYSPIGEMKMKKMAAVCMVLAMVALCSV